jgi:hypothetical protein
MHLRHVGRCFPTNFNAFMPGNVVMLGLGYDTKCGPASGFGIVSDLTEGSFLCSGVVFQMR